MRSSKKLPALTVVAALTLLSCLPATFSWYSHNRSADGTRLNLVQENLPVSVKSGANDVSYVTYIADEKGIASSTAANGISVTPAEKVKYYKTTFTNSGSNDVMVDLETLNMPNNADFYIGTLSPTLNEKAYASRPVRTKVSDNTVRVYFKTHNSFNPYWTHYTGDSATVTFNSSMTNDFNIAYKVSGEADEVEKKLNRCPNTGSAGNNTNVNDTWVFYYDLPSNIDYFYFFNHWYYASDTNREWNRTIDITELSSGRIYYLTGASVDDKWKEYKTTEIDDSLVAVNQYYKNVRMSSGTGVFADISLRKTGEEEDFVPEYYGQSIAYSSNNAAVAAVNKDGVITPGTNYGTATITTTVTGRYGDTRQVQTTVEIPQNIPQVPVIKNVRVPAGESVDVDWYALNKSTTADMTTSAFLYTL